MRVWDNTDPRLLNRKHLLAEHREIHALLNDDHNWGTNPEYARFRELGHYGRGLLVLRHELLRVAMDVRWPGRHSWGNSLSQRQHPTPLPPEDLRLLTDRMLGVLMIYERDCYVRKTKNVYYQQYLFLGLMSKLRWPASRLEGGAKTPWDRDDMAPSHYILLGDDWQRSEFHHKRHLYPKGH